MCVSALACEYRDLQRSEVSDPLGLEVVVRC